MVGQLTLDLDLAPVTPAPSGVTIEEAFDEFHRANPHVARNLRYLALQAVHAGRKRVGMKFLFERLRWEYFLKIEHDENAFALNNNFTSRYSRLLMKEDPELAGVFEVRGLKSD
jgi:hypothetical protein